MLLHEDGIELNEEDAAYGRTALLSAVSNGYTDVVSSLLQKKKVDVNASEFENRQAAFHKASVLAYVDYVDLLLKEDSIDGNMRTEDGHTALHCASANDHQTIVELLLKKIASRDSADLPGLTD